MRYNFVKSGLNWDFLVSADSRDPEDFKTGLKKAKEGHMKAVRPLKVSISNLSPHVILHLLPFILRKKFRMYSKSCGLISQAVRSARTQSNPNMGFQKQLSEFELHGGLSKVIIDRASQSLTQKD